MLYLLKLFSLDIIKYSAVLILGLFSTIIYIIENGAVLNAELIEKYQYYFIIGASIIYGISLIKKLAPLAMAQ